MVAIITAAVIVVVGELAMVIEHASHRHVRQLGFQDFSSSKQSTTLQENRHHLSPGSGDLTRAVIDLVIDEPRAEEMG